MYEQTPLLIVSDNDGLARLAERFATKRVIAVDTESDSMYHYQEKVCLLQFSDDEGDVIVDVLSITDTAPLGTIIQNPAITKVFHGSDYDVMCLRRDYGWQINGLFDTQIAARLIGATRLGLADLLGCYFGIDVDKTLQRHDWSQRPLLPDHIDYARGDTHYLLALRRILLRKVRALGRMGHLQEECARLSRKKVAHNVPDEDAYLKIKGAHDLDEDGLKVLRRLHLARDAWAKARDLPPYKTISNFILIDLARARPTSLDALDRALSGKRHLKQRFGKGLVEAVQQGLGDPPPARPKKRSRRNRSANEPAARLSGRQLERVNEGLRAWRNALCAGDPTITPFTTFSNGDLHAIARARPKTLVELSAVDGIRDWQVRDWGTSLLAELDALAPSGET